MTDAAEGAVLPLRQRPLSSEERHQLAVALARMRDAQRSASDLAKQAAEARTRADSFERDAARLMHHWEVHHAILAGEQFRPCGQSGTTPAKVNVSAVPFIMLDGAITKC